MIGTITAATTPVAPAPVSSASVVASSNVLTTLADLSSAGILRPSQVRALTETVRIALNTTDDATDIPLESLRDIPPATLGRGIRLGRGTIGILNAIAAEAGWTIGDRAVA